MTQILYLAYVLTFDSKEQDAIHYDDVHIFETEKAAENWIYEQMKGMRGFTWEIRPIALNNPELDATLKPRRIEEK